MSAGGKWLVFGTRGILESIDLGVTWRLVSHKLLEIEGDENFHMLSFRDVVWTGELFVALMTSRFKSTKIYTSLDGVEWTYRFDTGGKASTIIWAADKLIVPGEGSNIISSKDGFIWEKQLNQSLLEKNLHLNRIIHNGLKFVAFAENQIVTSFDGANWELQNNLSESSLKLKSILWDGNRFIVTGVKDGKTSIYTSLDAILWQHESSLNIAYDTMGVIDKNIVLAGENGNFALSSDLSEWRDLYVSVTEETLNDIEAWKQGQLVAVGENGVILSYIDDVWANSGTSNNANLLAVTSSSKNLVVVGDGGVILTSGDAENWLEKNSGTSNSLFDVVWSGSMFVAVGSYSTILTSADGEAWETKSLSFDNGVVWDELPLGAKRWIRSIHWSEKGFIAVGDHGFVVTSQDGEIWNVKDTEADINFTKITSGYGGYVAIGSGFLFGNGLFTSVDALNWVNQGNAIRTIVDISWGRGMFLSVGYVPLTGAPIIAASLDAVSWFEIPTSFRHDIYNFVGYRNFTSVKWLEGSFMMTGYRGVIISVE